MLQISALRSNSCMLWIGTTLKHYMWDHYKHIVKLEGVTVFKLYINFDLVLKIYYLSY